MMRLHSVVMFYCAAVLSLLVNAKALGGDRPNIYTFSGGPTGDRTLLYNHMLNYITRAIILEHLYPPGTKHQSSRFVVWHRNYIKSMEDYLISQNLPQFVPLPKWDAATAIPPEFLVGGGVDVDCPTWLFLAHTCSPLFDATPNVALPASLSSNLCRQVAFTSFRPTLEHGYHDGGHIAVGGAMGAFKSPAAPIFWLWHAQVDDVWFDWQCLCGLDEGTAFDTYTAAERITDIKAGIADAWIRDSDADVAKEPNNESGAVLWESKDIWVRNTPATPVGTTRFLNEHQHQNPEYAQFPANRPYIYVKVRNRGCTTISGQLHVYWANASTGLTWQTPHFDEVDTSPVTLTTITAGREHVGQFHWLDIPEPTAATGDHFCLIARFVASPASADPINGEASNVIITQNVKNSNQIAWKNLTIVDNDVFNKTVLIRNISPNGNLIDLHFTVPPEQQGNSIFQHGTVAIDLGQELLNGWFEQGAMGKGIKVDKNGIVHILGPDSTIENLPIKPNDEYLVNMHFGPGPAPCEDDTTVFHLRMIAYEGQTLLGGNTYEIRPQVILPSQPVSITPVNGQLVNCTASSLLLQAVTGGPAVTYQWFVDGVMIPNAQQVSYLATVSGHYTVLVGYNNGCNRLSDPVQVHIGSPPANDNPCNATLVGLGQPVEFDIVCATAEPGEVTPGPGSGSLGGCNSEDGWCQDDPDVQNSVWYRFTAPYSGTVTIHAGHQSHDVDHSVMVNTQLAVWQALNCGDYGSYQLIAANDNSGNHGVFGSDPALHNLSGLVAGAEYYVQIDGHQGGRGMGTLVIVAEPPCPADLNGDGNVNVDDLFTVIASWGDCRGCLADVDDDNDVDIDDLFAVIAAWGACPACTFVCPAGSQAEGEPCLVNGSIDTTNGGCNSTPTVFGTITPNGPAKCGISSTFIFGTSTRRDTDWYQFTVTATATYSITVNAEFPASAFIVQDVNPCANPVIVPGTDITTIGNCNQVTSTAANLNPGTYAVFVSTIFPPADNLNPCSTGLNDYWVRLQTP